MHEAGQFESTVFQQAFGMSGSWIELSLSDLVAILQLTVPLNPHEADYAMHKPVLSTAVRYFVNCVI